MAGIWHQLKNLPEGSVVRVFDAETTAGKVVYICHHEAPEPDGSRDTCVCDAHGEHWHILSRAMVELIKLRSDLAYDFIQAMSRE